MNDSANAQLANMPVVPGGANCFHLLEAAGGRVCVVHSVKGTNLLNNPKVTRAEAAVKLPSTSSISGWPLTLSMHNVAASS
jgi:hypothetical protein